MEKKSRRIKLFGPQWDAFNCKKRFILCSAGVQGGKTFVGTVWMLNKIQKYPNDYHLISAPSYKVLMQSTIPKFRELVGSNIAKYNEKDQEFRIANGSGKIFVRSADDPDLIEGMTLKSAWLDEAGNMKKRMWVIVQARTAIHQGQVFMTTTPYYMNWMYYDVFKPGEKGHPDFGLFRWMSVQNPAFPEAEFKRAMTTMGKTDFARRYKGLWRKREGLVYEEFNPLTMVFDGAPPVPIKETIAGVDWGYQHPAAIVVVGIADTPSHIVLDEVVKTKQTIDGMISHAKELKQRYNIKWFYADGARPEYVAAFNQAGLPTTIGNKEVVPGINEVRLRFKTGNIKVSKNCTQLLEELEMYAYPENAPNEDPIKQHDDALDALRYAIYTYRVAPAVTDPNPSPLWQEIKEDAKQFEGTDDAFEFDSMMGNDLI